MVRKEKSNRNAIMREIYLRLAYYEYEKTEETTNIREEMLYTRLKARNVIKEYIPKKPKKTYDIETWLANDKKSEVLTPKLTNKEGWVVLDHIEKEPCPYGTPEKHRYQYLNNELIEKEVFRYIVKKPGTRNRQEYKETIYRLKRTKKARRKLYEFFFEGEHTEKAKALFNISYYNIALRTIEDEKVQSLPAYGHHLISMWNQIREGDIKQLDKERKKELILFIKKTRECLDLVEKEIKNVTCTTTKKASAEGRDLWINSHKRLFVREIIRGKHSYSYKFIDEEGKKNGNRHHDILARRQTIRATNKETSRRTNNNKE